MEDSPGGVNLLNLISFVHSNLEKMQDYGTNNLILVNIFVFVGFSSESSPVLDSTVLFSSEASSEDGDEVPTIMTEEVFKSYIEWDLEAENRSEIVIVTAEEE